MSLIAKFSRDALGAKKNWIAKPSLFSSYDLAPNTLPKAQYHLC
jgi:hypothetical protein